jgi:hypothetical protein
MRAVNRGQAVEVRKHAPLAVMVARRQQRFWKWSWLLGPLLGAVQLLLVPVEVAVFNAGLATLGLAAFSVFWYRRAARAERLNLELAARRSSGSAAGSASHGHLPGERRGTEGRTPRGSGHRPGAGSLRACRPGPAPPRPAALPPAGQKRRGRR